VVIETAGVEVATVEEVDVSVEVWGWGVRRTKQADMQ
jgi:hypothetical protein